MLKSPYCDDPHNYGIHRTSVEDLKFMQKVIKMDFQMNMY